MAGHPTTSTAPLASAGTPSLVALDWGTSSLRAFCFDAGGQVLEMRHRPWGIMHLPPAPDGAPDTVHSAAFERALHDTCGDWLSTTPALPLVACGMVGSAQGWKEAPYLNTPTSLDDLARSLTVVHRGTDKPLHIVPGLLQRGSLPNVMRGEETQVLGVLAGGPATGDASVLIGLPGTHSKWVTATAGAQGRCIQHFDTFMTGEVFAALRGHTILGKTMQTPAAPDDTAFARGLAVARGDDAQRGLLSHIFSSRTLGLTGALPASAQADYLSGILIGHEISALAPLLTQGPAGRPATVVLCGENDLCRRYAKALQAYGLPAPVIAENATALGLWQIACAASLIPPVAPATGSVSPRST
ncbi:2-dehydro-3-deoxygalactonokinase [Acidovorax radicis]|jgi:2-dehydro-3-deoxygalactonokinase|uniref:2-dehydro-3-deoxygalactonokinase n=1 Tax=Acidovorax radicis TaxID=758826 RepID=UPI001CF8B9F5|nr:2-dehydro-3-deoxygalactonokinase [Acidovorax radicis]UCU97623.1 2-dehydro-3-deoxygalactonokinase [Acidovorax radicis]